MKKINIENIHLLIGENQPGSNSELFEFSIYSMATADEQYSFVFSYSSNTSGTKYSGYFQLMRQIENYTDERGRDVDVCRCITTLWENGKPSANIDKDTVIPLAVIKQYDLLYLFIRSYIREVIG
jgi:hypothetical protein